MLDLIHHIQNPTDIDLNSLPASVYWKDKNGIYLGCNRYAAEKMHKLNYIRDIDPHYISGKDDFDLFSSETANLYRNNDFEVLQKNITVVYQENIHLGEGKIFTQVSSKKPLKNQNQEVIGLIGITFALGIDENFAAVAPLSMNAPKQCPLQIAKPDS